MPCAARQIATQPRDVGRRRWQSRPTRRRARPADVRCRRNDRPAPPAPPRPRARAGPPARCSAASVGGRGMRGGAIGQPGHDDAAAIARVTSRISQPQPSTSSSGWGAITSRRAVVLRAKRVTRHIHEGIAGGASAIGRSSAMWRSHAGGSKSRRCVTSPKRNRHDRRWRRPPRQAPARCPYQLAVAGSGVRSHVAGGARHGQAVGAFDLGQQRFGDQPDDLAVHDQAVAQFAIFLDTALEATPTRASVARRNKPELIRIQSPSGPAFICRCGKKSSTSDSDRRNLPAPAVRIEQPVMGQRQADGQFCRRAA